MSQDDYTTPGLPPPPPISSTVLPLNPYLLTVHGLDELPSPESHIVVLWLLHPRGRTRERMNDIASRVVHAYYDGTSSQGAAQGTAEEISREASQGTAQETAEAPPHGLVTISFDMPNHGTRLIHPTSNLSWEKGNPTHALDLFSMIRTARVDLSLLIDLLPMYLSQHLSQHHHHQPQKPLSIISHMALGWSLGAHSIWQAYLLEPRLSAVVSIVGCPDFRTLMRGRAEKSGVKWEEAFPPGLEGLCEGVDPMYLLSRWEEDLKSGTGEGGEKVTKLKEKKLLLCSGAEDHLVPYECAKGAIDKLKGLGVDFEDKVYEGVGHRFSKDMVIDAVDFLVRNAKAAGQ